MTTRAITHLASIIAGINKLEIELENKRHFKYLCPVRVGHLKTHCLIDSGNLATNCISAEFAKKLFGASYRQHIRALPKLTRIGTAKKGSSLPVLGVTKRPLLLRLGGSSCEFKTTPLVIKGLTMPFNICVPYLAKHKIDQIHSTGNLRVKGKNIPLVTYREAFKTKKSIQSIPSSEKMRTYVEKTVTVLPQTVKRVFLRIPKLDSQLGTTTSHVGVLKGSSLFMQKTDLHPTLNAIVQLAPDTQLVASTVMNTTNEEIKVQKGTYFGTF